MTSYRGRKAQRVLLLGLSGLMAAATLSAAVPGARAADRGRKNGAAPAPRLVWRPCERPGGPAGQECAELPVPLNYRDPAGPRITLAVSRVRHPLTVGMPANVTPCAFWKDRPADEPVRISDRGPADVLMIQNLRDPSTPYFGARKMRTALGQRARMVTLDHGGHGAYLANGNACGDRTVTGYLRDGRWPQADVSCPK
ncbi:alpha/beta hydrolase [Streptomyces sp. MspMP-M5]|uniref:alpha/beta hydrolase n=1 Tax=Streptomyces sp. MspMP-M5 TaxID=1155718 RepID=UPI003B6339EC